MKNHYERIHLASPHMSGLEMDYITEAFDTNWIAPLGENVDQFEKEVCDYTGAGYGVALSSGTAAIHLGLKYLGVKKGDIVFCSSLTFSASCNPIVYLGATPVFIDSEYKTWNMCPKALEKAYEKYPNPKAVVTVNLYGQSADYDEILKITSRHNTPVLEDAAESLGATYKGRQTGTFGDIGVYSFNGNKIITTSGGGMLVSKNKMAKKKVKFWASQAKDDRPYYFHTEIGYNYRMSNIVAGIGRGQLKVLDERIAKKKYIYEYYKKAFKDIDDIEMMPIVDFGESNYWLSCLTIKESSKLSVKDIICELEKENIDSRHIWKPMHTQPVFEKYPFFTDYEDLSCAEDIFYRGICMPSDTKMTDMDLKRVVDLVIELFERQSNADVG